MLTEPIATVALLLTTFGVSLWAFENEQVTRRYRFRPEDILAGKEYYRLISSAFLHAGWAHLMLNLFTLNAFGRSLERQFGATHLLLIYFASVVGGNLLSLYLHRNHDYSAYGASGGVCGLIFASILRSPDSRMLLFPLPAAVPGWLFALVFMAASFYAMKRQADQIGHDAHLGGAAIGLLTAAALHPDLVQRRPFIFLGLLLVCGLIFAYALGNPLFLPLTSFWGERRPAPPRARPGAASGRGRTAGRVPGPSVARVARPGLAEPPQPDWLFAEIESHVGKLEREALGSPVWTDKFRRRYWVMEPKPEAFDFAACHQAVMDLLNDAKVHFVILDTRALLESQVNQIRPFIADLPDAQFSRVLRSYAFTPKQRSSS